MLLNLYSKIQALRANRDRGATAVEYGLIVAAIAAVIVVVVFTLGGQVQGAFQHTSDCIANNGTC
jgi:pilus assembly protein Flp/PilA